jgi:hypothetical protein
MLGTRMKLAAVASLVAAFGVASGVASAETQNHREHSKIYHVHMAHHHRGYEHALTVGRNHEVAPVEAPAYDPYHGSAAIVTAPVALGRNIVGLPFQAFGTVFPYRGNPGNNPLILIGAPVHVAGMIVGLPFHIVESAFGGPTAYTY